METRAFLNMHTTFVDCVVCHEQGRDGGFGVAWVDLATRAERGAPALLDLATELERLFREGFGDREETSRRLQGLLRRILAEAGEQRELRHWLTDLETTHPESRGWERLLEDIALGVPLHAHGEYGAKLGLVDAGGRPPVPDPAREAAATRWLAEATALGEPERARLEEEVHGGLAEEGYRCTPCHTLTSAVISFAGLGYAPARVRELESNAVIRQALRIEEGESFFLPTFLESGDAE